MDPQEMTRDEMLDCVRTNINNLNDYDVKWLYCYFNGFDKWPIVIDDKKLVTPRHKVWKKDEVLL